MKKSIAIVLLMIMAWSCSQQDYSDLNTDRRNCKYFVRVSKRFSWTWDSLTTIKGNPEGACDSAMIWLQAYRDTLYWSPASCPPPVASMPEFRIEIRYYEQVNFKQ